ncbi:hypothetical protein Tco_0575654 [Tanacetum coccineum]
MCYSQDLPLPDLPCFPNSILHDRIGALGGSITTSCGEVVVSSRNGDGNAASNCINRKGLVRGNAILSGVSGFGLVTQMMLSNGDGIRNLSLCRHSATGGVVCAVVHDSLHTDFRYFINSEPGTGPSGVLYDEEVSEGRGIPTEDEHEFQCGAAITSCESPGYVLSTDPEVDLRIRGVETEDGPGRISYGVVGDEGRRGGALMAPANFADFTAALPSPPLLTTTTSLLVHHQHCDVRQMICSPEVEQAPRKRGLYLSTLGSDTRWGEGSSTARPTNRLQGAKVVPDDSTYGTMGSVSMTMGTQ